MMENECPNLNLEQKITSFLEGKIDLSSLNPYERGILCTRAYLGLGGLDDKKREFVFRKLEEDYNRQKAVITIRSKK